MCLCWFWMVFTQTNFIEADWKAERLAVRSSFWWPEALKSWNKQGQRQTTGRLRLGRRTAGCLFVSVGSGSSPGLVSRDALTAKPNLPKGGNKHACTFRPGFSYGYKGCAGCCSFWCPPRCASPTAQVTEHMQRGVPSYIAFAACSHGTRSWRCAIVLWTSFVPLFIIHDRSI
jgi:hypothetical protein